MTSLPPPPMHALLRALALALLLAGHHLTVAPARAATLGEALAQLLASGTGVSASEQHEAGLALLTRCYRERRMAPLWVTPAGATARGAELVAVLRGIGQDGLDPEDYQAGALATLLAAREPHRLAALEVRLSLALLKAAADLAAGRLEPSKVDPEHFIYPDEVDPAQMIRAAAEAPDIGAFLAGFRPAQDEYRRLRAALADLRAAAVGWPRVADGPTLEQGARHARVGQLRARLRATADLPPGAYGETGPADPDLYDAVLLAAVERFQARHGLERDGRVGSRTLAALNVPVERRIRQVMLNLERRRWMPDQLGERHVFVNLADFHAKLVVGPKTVFDTRVVIGAPYHRTPSSARR